IFRQPPQGFRSPPSSAFKSHAFGEPLIELARRSKAIEWRLGHLAWGVFRAPEGGRVRLAISQGDDTEVLEGRSLLIATGAYDLWRALPGTERVHQADTLVVGYGLLASSELARQAGCAVRWRPAEGGWIVQHDERMRTSVDGVYVAGEPAGVGGAELAFLQG